MDETDKNTLNTVKTACDVIDALQRLGGAGVTEVAAEVGCSKSTAHRQLATLYEKEYVVKDDGVYRLNLKYLDLAKHVENQIENYDVIRAEVDNLARETGEVAQFATEEHGRAVYIYKAKGEDGVETSSDVGTRAYLHSISLGNAMLAYMPRDRIEAIIDRHGLERKTRNTITTREELFEELERTREQGFALDDEENVMGLRCVAAPVLEDDTILGAVSVSGPSRRVKGDYFRNDLPEAVTRTANVIQLNSKFS